MMPDRSSTLQPAEIRTSENAVPANFGENPSPEATEVEEHFPEVARIERRTPSDSHNAHVLTFTASLCTEKVSHVEVILV